MYEESRYATANSTGPLAGAQVARQPQVYEVLEALEKTVEAHQKLAAEMEGRLSPVLRSEPELAEGPRDDQKESTVVGLAGRIKQTEKVLHRLSAQYNSILRRLEI